jgi:hypothetical protein
VVEQFDIEELNADISRAEIEQAVYRATLNKYIGIDEIGVKC